MRLEMKHAVPQNRYTQEVERKSNMEAKWDKWNKRGRYFEEKAKMIELDKLWERRERAVELEKQLEVKEAKVVALEKQLRESKRGWWSWQSSWKHENTENVPQ